MGEDHGLGVLTLHAHDLFHREARVDMASAVPQEHVAASHAVYVRAEVIVGPKDYLLVLGEGVDDLLCVARCHHNIGERLHLGSGVDVAHHLVARVLRLILAQIFGAARVGERASCSEVRCEHQLVGREDLACLRHEMHATHEDDLCICLCSLTRQGQ